MEDDPHSPGNFALVATLFEASLAVAAVGLGWLFGHRPTATFQFDGVSFAWGLAATVPPLVLFGLCLVCPWAPFARLAKLVDRLLVPMFRQCTVVEIAAISLVAGIGEEMLFRGLLQGGLAERIGGPAGIWVGLAAGSFAFGLAHPISPTYSILTGLIGFYLGWLWIYSGNLLVPITTHAAYDFLALVYLIKIRSPGADGNDQGEHADREDERKNTVS
ncbi:MAG: CPBP family intramembrane metalloprotease [Pirellulales bacterium]|nr:CPBP family intramembrane metalloprotease [Pirellulales bacterium]